MNSPHYEFAQNVTSLLNMCFIMVNEVIKIKSESYLQIWFICMIIINCIFGLELFIDILINGFYKAYSQHLRVWFESICQIINIFLMINFYSHFHAYQMYNTFLMLFTLIIFIRGLKMLSLMYEVQSLRIIIETMKNLIEPISNMAAVLLIIFFFFSLLGMFLFGGKITTNLPYPITEGTYTVPPTYHLVNFNDFLSSMVTLFTLMVVNNWMVQVSQYIYVMKLDNVNENLVRAYFIAFYYFSVILGINIVVAFVLDMYSSTERMDKERINTMKMIKEKMSGNMIAREAEKKQKFDKVKEDMLQFQQLINAKQ